MNNNEPTAVKTAAKYSISDLVERYDTSLRTLRFYEEHGLVRPQRVNRHTRVYSQSDVETLDFVFACRDMGLAVRTISALLTERGSASPTEFAKTFDAAMEQRLEQIDEQISLLEKERNAIIARREQPQAKSA